MRGVPKLELGNQSRLAVSRHGVFREALRIHVLSHASFIDF